jgi:hypothetical protein
MTDDESGRKYAEIVEEVRAQVAAGGEPDLDEVTARIRSIGGRGQKRAVEQVRRVVAIQRARALLAREPAPPPARRAPAFRGARPPARPALRSRPTITGNMDVRSTGSAEQLTLSWKPVPRVAEWEVRISERPDPRSEYDVLEARTLAPETTAVDVELGPNARRVHILGRTRGGQLLARAIVSGLTSESWDERWQRRASAS